VTALDILDNFDKNAKKIEALGQEKWNICIDRIATYMREHVLNKKQVSNFGKFVKVIPDELIIHVWTSLVRHEADCDVRNKNIVLVKDELVPHIQRVTAPAIEAMKAQLEQKK